MTAAVSGITRLRNTIMSNRNDRPTTSAMKSGSFDASTLAKSMKIAVLPPTRMERPELPHGLGDRLVP